MDETVVTEEIGRVRLIRLNRPKALNAMNQALIIALRDVLLESAEDSNIAVCVLTGEGRAFCAGQDMDEMSTMNGTDASQTAFPSMLKQLIHFPKPLIAAVNGVGVGIGMTMLAYCDLVLMADSAKLRTPFPQLGLAPEAGSSFTFQHRMGWQNAAYTLMSGRWLSAEECHEFGYAWRLVDIASLLEETLATANEMAMNPIPSLIATKKLMLAAGRSKSAWAAHVNESEAYASLMGAEANKEAVAAFKEKREADFSKIPGL